MSNENQKEKTGTEVAVKQPDVYSQFVDNIKESWSLVLPKVCTPDRFARVALSCIKKDKKLMDAVKTQEGRLSLAEQFMKCAELGIEPDGRRAYLIPYKNDIQLIIDYKGIAELAMRSGYVSNIHADKVCENDEFVYNMGNIEKHIIDFKKDRGEPYAYYAVVSFKDGTKKCEVMSKAEIEKIKERSSAWKAYVQYRKICPWNTDYDEMAKKTVFKRLAKWIPQSPEVQKAIEIDDEDYRFNRQSFNPLDIIPEDEDRYKTVEFNPQTGEVYDAEPEYESQENFNNQDFEGEMKDVENE